MSRQRYLGLIPWIALICIWAALTWPRHRVVGPLFLASPRETASALYEGIVVSRSLLKGLGITVLRAGMGFALASVIGVPIGVAIGGIATVSKLLGSFVDGLRSMPATAMYPVFLLAFGAGDSSKIAVAVFVCTWAIAIYTIYGVTASGQTRRFLLRLHNVGWWQYFMDGLLLPALPAILGGMRTAVSLAFVITIGVEMIVGTKLGLGQAIYDAQSTYRIPDMYAALTLAAIAGIALNRLFVLASTWLAPWEPK